MDVTELSKQKQKIAQTDPITLVSQAKTCLYEIPEKQREEPQFWALEEVISRFEQASRSHLGVSNTLTPTGSSSQ